MIHDPTVTPRPTLAVPGAWRLPAVGLGYFACTAFSLSFARFDSGVAFVWVANAFLIAWLALLPLVEHRRTIAVCMGASIVATVMLGNGLPGLPLSIIAVIEAVASVRLLRRLLRKSGYFDSIKGVWAFALVAGGLVPALGSIAAGLVAFYVLDKPFVANATGWFTGHALGTLALTPAMSLLLTAQRRQDGVPRARRVLEAACVFGGVVLITLAVFAQEDLPLLFLPMLPMMIATLRLERVGAAVSIVLLTLVAGAFTLADTGPVTSIHGPQGLRIQFLQFYIATAAALVLPVAALFRERSVLLADRSASEAAYRLLTESAGDAMFRIALDGTIEYVSHSVLALSGLGPRDLIGTNALDTIHADDRALVIAAHTAAIGEPGKTFPVEYRCVRSDGRILWFESRTRAIVDERGKATGAVSAIREVSDRKAAESELTRAATTDALTGLLNRRGFMTALDRTQEIGDRGSAVAIIDLDHFKLVNDRHGHAVGDRVLCAFADVARAMLRSSDTIGRIGGEEFALLLRDIDIDRTMALCERLRVALEAARVDAPDGSRVGITASFGIARVGGTCIGTEALAAADRALYEAKSLGRNRLRLAA